MRLEVIHSLTDFGVLTVEVTEANFRQLKEQLKAIINDLPTSAYKNENGVESIKVYGITVLSKKASQILVN